MKKLFLLFIFFLTSVIAVAQLCPGGGTTFSNAVAFDPTWISGCSNGTTCTGGQTFDNRAACEPTTAMDACAPNPSCGLFANMGSDLWYKFYATATSATITVNQNVSFVASIQAFSGGPTCGALVEKGCVIAGGPSGGVTLSLTGLTVGTLYYFRVFGTSSSSAQRTGTFCFCGSAGMSNVVLPIKLLSFNGAVSGNSAILSWSATMDINFSRFEIERSKNGTDFTIIGTKLSDYSSSLQQAYSFEDKSFSGSAFYRLKMLNTDGRFEYSSIVKVNAADQAGFNATFDNKTKSLQITAGESGDVDVYTATGEKTATIKVKKGFNTISCSWLNGIYFIRQRGSSATKKIIAVD